MLTISKMLTYRRFNGNIDGWIRATSGQDTSGINDSDWKLIDELRQALYFAWSGMASADFQSRVEQQLNDSTDSEETRQIFREMLKEDFASRGN